MEEQQDGTAGPGGGKRGWGPDCSLSGLLKHSCLLCWAPGTRDPRDPDPDPDPEKPGGPGTRVPDQLRELENAVAVEQLELQEQQSDRKELEETLQKLETHKEKLIQQIKATRLLCYQESQQILSLQAEEVQKESQVEEYEKELARARWRLKRLREEVKLARRKVQEAQERNTPLQDSIRQSYEEILQEENALCSLSGGGATPESQLEESASPTDTTEDDLVPMKPWGRSQSLPAYADLIMGAGDLSFCNNLAGTREENDSGTSSPKDMDRSDSDEEGEAQDEGDEEGEQPVPPPDPLGQMDFYQDDPFLHCQNDPFSENLFPKTDGFASDPFKGSNPFAADVLFPEADADKTNAAAEADTSLSCAENKASTGTQCFESEFPDDDSDIEISYSREDLDAIAVDPDAHRFKPIQSSSEELDQDWRSKGQFSVESDPNGYELDLGTVSDPEGHGQKSPVLEDTEPQPGLSCGSALVIPEPTELVPLDPDGSGAIEQIPPGDLAQSQAAAWTNEEEEEEPSDPLSPQDLPDPQTNLVQPDSDQNSFEFSFDPTSQSSCDPYGFKLSPEHSSHTLLDPDEAELSPEPENEMSFDPELSSSQPHELDFDPYGFDLTASQVVRDSDPYGFKLSPEEENQEVLDLCDLPQTIDPSTDGNQVLIPHNCENQEVLPDFSTDFQEPMACGDRGNQEALGPGTQELLDFGDHVNQEKVDPCPDTSREGLDPCSSENRQILDWCSPGYQGLERVPHPENQEVLDPDSYENQELLDFCSQENQEVLVTNRNQETRDLKSPDDQALPDSRRHGNQEVPESLPEAKRVAEAQLSLSSSSTSWDSDGGGPDPPPPGLRGGSSPSAPPHTAPPTAPNSLQMGAVFGAGGYVGCPDVADDLEPWNRPVEEPVRPVRPPRPSLMAKDKAGLSRGIDLK